MSSWWMEPSEEEIQAARLQELARRGGVPQPGVGMSMQSPLGAGDKGYLDKLLGDESFTSSLEPQDAERRRLDMQMAMAEALMGSSQAQRAKTPLGAIFAGIGDIVNADRGAKLRGEAEKGFSGLSAAQAKGATNRLRLQRAFQGEDARLQAEREAARQQAEAERAALEHERRKELVGLREGEPVDPEMRKAELELKQARAKYLQRGPAAPKPPDPDKKATEVRKIEEGLRNKFLENQQTKGVQGSAEFYRQVAGAPETGTGDLSRIYGLAKLYDPSGRVTDSDLAVMAKQGGLPGHLQGYFNNLTAQGSLAPKVRKEMAEEARRIMRERVGAFKPFRTQFERMAKEAGGNPANVVIDFGLGEFEQESQPASQAQPPTMMLKGKRHILQPDGTYLPE